MKRYITLRAAFGAAALLAAGCAHAQEKVKIGLLTDLSGVYADVDGNGSATAIRMAIEDFGGKALGQPIELVTGDHQNKPDLASTKTREWLDITGVTMVIGGGSSAATLAMTQIAREKKRVMFAGSSGAVAITNEACTPYTIAYSWDTRAYSRGTAKAVVDAGGKSWYFLTVDYAAGHAFEADAGATVKASGGTVVGSSRHPINAPDFSSQLVTTQASNAQVLGLANAGGGDTINAIKSAREFGLTKNMKVAALILYLTDVHSLGLRTAEGIMFTTTWYWNLNDQTRAFARRFFEKSKRMPTDVQAANYSSALTYLKAVQAAKTTDADKVMAQMKATPVNDMYAKGTIRPDGRFVQDKLYLVQVKSQAESQQPWDYLKLVSKVPGEKLYTTKAETKCALWK